MGQEQEFTLCRLETNHWCIECCPPNCCLLGELQDNTLGCLGYSELHEGLTRTGRCYYVNCIDGFTPDQITQLLQHIRQLPPGNFRMSEALKQAKIKTLVSL